MIRLKLFFILISIAICIDSAKHRRQAYIHDKSIPTSKPFEFKASESKTEKPLVLGDFTRNLNLNPFPQNSHYSYECRPACTTCLECIFEPRNCPGNDMTKAPTMATRYPTIPTSSIRPFGFPDDSSSSSSDWGRAPFKVRDPAEMPSPICSSEDDSSYRYGLMPWQNDYTRNIHNLNRGPYVVLNPDKWLSPSQKYRDYK